MRLPSPGKYIKVYKITGAGQGALQQINTNVISLLEEESLTLNLSSSFEFLAENKSNKALSALALELQKRVAGTRLENFTLSGQFNKLAFKVWTSTDAIKFNLTVGFYQSYNAEIEVMQPIKTLASLHLPSGTGVGGQLRVPGVAPTDALLGNYAGAVAVRWGPLLLYPLIIERAEPTYSNETDTSGGAMWGRLSMDFTGLQTATKELFSIYNFNSKLL